MAASGRFALCFVAMLMLLMHISPVASIILFYPIPPPDPHPEILIADSGTSETGQARRLLEHRIEHGELTQLEPRPIILPARRKSLLLPGNFRVLDASLPVIYAFSNAGLEI